VYGETTPCVTVADVVVAPRTDIAISINLVDHDMDFVDMLEKMTFERS
jgi:hypothetical protein